MGGEGFSADRVVLVAVLLLARAAGATAADQRYLFNKLDLATGKSPSAVGAGDFREIGKLDLVVANRDSNSISVFLGKPDGTFQSAVDYDVLASPLSVAVGDFNRDHKLDIVVADRSVSRVSVLLGNGDGTFQPHVDYPSGTGPPAPYFIACGDFNNDGKLDIAVVTKGSGAVAVVLGNGDGTFGLAQYYSAGRGIIQTVTAGDYDGDGNFDLALSGSPGLGGFLGKGDGTFSAPLAYMNFTGADFISVDLDGDGAVGVAAASSIPGVGYNTPAGALYPNRFDFGKQPLGTSCAPRTVTLSNSGPAPILIKSIALTSLNRTEFTATHTCGDTLAPGENCTITVTFTPVTAGFKWAYVTILDNGQHKLQERSRSPVRASRLNRLGPSQRVILKRRKRRRISALDEPVMMGMLRGVRPERNEKDPSASPQEDTRGSA
jgi:hypothetical protein